MMFKQDAIKVLEKIPHNIDNELFGRKAFSPPKKIHHIGGENGIAFPEGYCPYCELKEWLEKITILVD